MLGSLVPATARSPQYCFSPRPCLKAAVPARSRLPTRRLRCSSSSNNSSSTPTGSAGSGGGPPHSNKPSGGGGSDDSSPPPQRTWPRWYTVWIWATALVYLAWRYKWRRDRRLAAEQFAQEQQLEEEQRQEWYSFARSYGVQTPPAGGSTS